MPKPQPITVGSEVTVTITGRVLHTTPSGYICIEYGSPDGFERRINVETRSSAVTAAVTQPATSDSHRAAVLTVKHALRDLPGAEEHAPAVCVTCGGVACPIHS